MGSRIPCGAVAVRLSSDIPRPPCYNSPVMPTLSRLEPRSCLFLLRRAPFWAQALALCALFAIAGVAALDDYGVAVDVTAQRQITSANADYIIIGDTAGLYKKDYRYYGVAFEMPLLLLERALGLQDTRPIHLARHLVTHLFFIAGGFVCGMLAYRTLGSRWAALFAMLLFLLHPRLYAHSFVNTKDIPFAVALVVALYLTRRAFRRDTLGAFLLCGVVVGLAINLRPFALMLPPAILAMRALDIWQAGRAERKRILLTSAAFLAAALATTYITHPYYWENPLRFIEVTLALSQHPTVVYSLFMGEIYKSDAMPWNFIPMWFAITAPPVALPLGAIGCAAVCWQGAARPFAALRDRETRFRILLLCCLVMPVSLAIALQANIYNDWRHMYFLWGPFCLLAAVGLRALANNNAGRGIWKVGARLPGWVRIYGLRQALAYGIAGVGLLTTLTAMAALHPHQQVYFNALTDTNTPGALAKRYELDYWRMAQRQSLEYLLARYPDDALRTGPGHRSLQILPQNDRERILISRKLDAADYYIFPIFLSRSTPEEPTFHSIEAYGSAIAYILAPTADTHRDYYRAEYEDAASNGTLLARSDFDIYIHNGALYYLKENCAPLLISADFRIFLHIFPADPADLPANREEFGFENRDFWVSEHFGFFGERCIHRHILPDYPIDRIRTGRNNLEGKAMWRADIDLDAHAIQAAAQALYERIAAGDYGQPVAQSGFDMYIRDNALAYLKEPCAAGDADARFFLHIYPAEPADLPAARRGRGFENRDFRFADHGGDIGGKCVAERELPSYPIERVRTGQFVGEDQLWGIEFPAAR